MPDICVIGLGYVGLPTASLLARSGADVLGVDICEHTVAEINSGRTSLKEEGLARVVAKAVSSGKLVASTKPQAAEIFIICVPTPTTPENGVDLSAVKSAARAIASVATPGCLVILESTSPVSTTRDVVGKIFNQARLTPGLDVDLCYCPERVLPGDTVGELERNDRVIGGMTPKAAARARDMYARFCKGELTVTDDLTAELVKLMENTSRDVSIALANVFARIAEEWDINVWPAIELANRHPRVNILSPGPGVGGHCIPVDPWFLIEQNPALTGLLREAREVNDTQARRMVDRLLATGQLPTGGRLAILGAAYKADIDDARESPAWLVAAAAEASGQSVAIHDPLVSPGEHHGYTVTNELERALDGADAAIFVTDHTAYRTLDPKRLAVLMSGRLLGDCRNILDRAEFRLAGFTIVAVGVAPALIGRAGVLPVERRFGRK